MAAFATYGIALIVRPVGALLFGRLADLRGRRAVFVPIILIMAGATAASDSCRAMRSSGSAVDQILVTALNLDVAPGLYVSVVACLALLALWRWPETAFKPTV